MEMSQKSPITPLQKEKEPFIVKYNPKSTAGTSKGNILPTITRYTLNTMLKSPKKSKHTISLEDQEDADIPSKNVSLLSKSRQVEHNELESGSPHAITEKIQGHVPYSKNKSGLTRIRLSMNKLKRDPSEDSNGRITPEDMMKIHPIPSNDVTQSAMMDTEDTEARVASRQGIFVPKYF